MSRRPDIVEDSRLETRWETGTGHTVHVHMSVDSSRQRIRSEEHWKFEKVLGRGAYGEVSKEICTSGQRDVSVRAVKMIYKSTNPFAQMNLDRELEAIAKFSNCKVWNNAL